MSLSCRDLSILAVLLGLVDEVLECFEKKGCDPKMLLAELREEIIRRLSDMGVTALVKG